MNTESAESIHLRPVEQHDLPAMFEMQLDPDSNRRAVTIPRSLQAFDTHWNNALQDPQVTARVILLGESLAGYIACFVHEGHPNVGYWIKRELWGRGIASCALDHLLKEVRTRPLFARVATSNEASLRVLKKCGFIVDRIEMSPATDRYPECEDAFLVLNPGL